MTLEGRDSTEAGTGVDMNSSRGANGLKAGKEHRQLLRLVPSVRVDLAAAVAAGLLATVLLIVQALLLSWIVRDVLFRHGTLSDVAPLLALAAGAATGRAVLIALREFEAKRAAIGVKRELRTRLAEHILRLGPAYAHGERTGELTATATEGIEKLDPYVSRYLPHTVLGATVPLAIALAILPVDPLSAGLLLFTVPVILLLMILIGTFTRDHVQRQWETLGRLSTAFLDIIQGLPDLVLLDRDSAERQRMERISMQFRDRTLSVLKVAFLSGAILELMTAAGIGLIATVLGVRLLDGGIPFDRAFFVFLLTPEFYRPLRDLGTHRHAVIEGSAAAGRILEILNTPAEIPSSEDAVRNVRGGHLPSSPGPFSPSGRRGAPERGRALDLDSCRWKGDEPFWTPPARIPPLPDGERGSGGEGRTRGKGTGLDHVGPLLTITLEDVSYTYPGREQPALSHITLTLEAGTCTALIGQSGSGKSTLVNLLLRAMEPQGGKLTANGVPLRATPVEVWREHVALVPQRPYLFTGTLRDNIRLARPEARTEEIVRAAELAGCLPFIGELPNGFDTVIGERGEGLSAGQRQRIAIARAFIKDAPLLVLDEPTSALDPESEAQLRQALTMLMRNRTVLVVAHRFNTVRVAGRVAVLANGELAEAGEHDELLRYGGVYASLLGAGRPQQVTA